MAKDKCKGCGKSLSESEKANDYQKYCKRCSDEIESDKSFKYKD